MVTELVQGLEGRKLNHWVAKALGWEVRLWGAIPVYYDPSDENRFRSNVDSWNPIENPFQSVPIMEREGIHLWRRIVTPTVMWDAQAPKSDDWYAGSTMPIAGMRAFVASKFGNTVPLINLNEE